MAKKESGVTLLEVARKSGVSRSLASLALRGEPGVSQVRRAHILQVADRLNYVPDPHARGLASGRSRTLGVVIGYIENPFVALLAKAVDSAARQQGYGAVLSINGSPDEAAVEAANALVAERCAGLVLIAAPEREESVAQIAKRVPLVYIGRHSSNPAVSSVSNDNQLGAALVVEHLAALGHTQIAHIDGGAGPGAGSRRAGYVRTLQALGLRPRMIAGAYTIDAGWAGCAVLMEAADPPTAIFAANDMTAIGVMNYLYRAGCSVPGDVSVVGYDDMPLSGTAAFSLTTVRQPVEQLASQAVFSVLEAIRAPHAAATRAVVMPELVVRGTTGRAGAKGN